MCRRPPIEMKQIIKDLPKNSKLTLPESCFCYGLVGRAYFYSYIHFATTQDSRYGFELVKPLCRFRYCIATTTPCQIANISHIYNLPDGLDTQRYAKVTYQQTCRACSRVIQVGPTHMESKVIQKYSAHVLMQKSAFSKDVFT